MIFAIFFSFQLGFVMIHIILYNGVVICVMWGYLFKSLSNFTDWKTVCCF